MPEMSGLRIDIQRHGLAKAISARLYDRLERWFGLHIWSVQTRPLQTDYDLPEDHARRFTFKQLGIEEALIASRDPALDLTPEFLREAFARGDFCTGAYEGEHLVAYSWRTTKCAPVAGTLWLRLEKENCQYVYKTLVLPSHRGNRLKTSAGRVHDYEFVERGVTRNVSYIALSNLESLKSSFRDPDRRRLGYAGFLKCRGRYFPFRTAGVKPYISLHS
jgi:hypothetical protein